MNFIIKRNLKDFDSWKKVVSELDGMRREYGSKGGIVYRNANNPNEVYIVFDWDEGKPPADYFSLPAVQKSLSETGTIEVIEVSETFILEE